MKTYRFKVRNWKTGRAFWLYRTFPSSYAADRFCARIVMAKNSPYTCALWDWE